MWAILLPESTPLVGTSNRINLARLCLDLGPTGQQVARMLVLVSDEGYHGSTARERPGHVKRPTLGSS